ncbi:MAG: hypothetical protein M3323_03210 [Actinomycetota bacterium]|nr:hypothetical protein [Actinomycetota bacterium]
MKKLVLAVIVALGAGAAAAPAAAFPLPQEIREDTTWARADSPVRLDAGVLIHEGVTLTVEPGVRVEAQPWAGIVVIGALRATGTETEPVVFTGTDGGRWPGIAFADTGRDRPSSAVEHARVENARVGIAMRRDAFPVHDTVFTGNETALEVTNPSATLSFTRNEFYSNGTAFSGKTQRLVRIYESDFWDNEISMLFRAQNPYRCVDAHGVFDVNRNDILRGPDAPWYSFDVRTSDGSGTSSMVVDASENWWGSTHSADIAARTFSPYECCPANGRAPVDWRNPAAAPQTPAEPPGPAGAPEQEPEFHGDPAWIASVREPDDRDCHPEGSVTRIHGRVDPALSDIPKRLDVSLVRLARGRCRSWDPDARRFGPPHGCGTSSTFRVRVDEVHGGRGRWEVELPRPLPRGRYAFAAGYDLVRFRVLPG